jgi:hypothetical protein
VLNHIFNNRLCLFGTRQWHCHMTFLHLDVLLWTCVAPSHGSRVDSQSTRPRNHVLWSKNGALLCVHGSLWLHMFFTILWRDLHIAIIKNNQIMVKFMMMPNKLTPVVKGITFLYI